MKTIPMKIKLKKNKNFFTGTDIFEAFIWAAV